MMYCSNNGHDDDNQDNRNGYPNDNTHLKQYINFKWKGLNK